MNTYVYFKGGVNMSGIVSCVVKLKPNSHMTKYLNDTCSYRRYCWNLGLETWQKQYQLHKEAPNEYKYPSYFGISELLTQRKKDWQYQYSSHTMCLAIRDVAHAFKYFHNKNQANKFPKFKRKHDGKDSFKTDRVRIVDGKLRLDKPKKYKKPFYDIRIYGLRNIEGKLKQCHITKINNEFYASLFFEQDSHKKLSRTGRKTAIDVNVGHFDYTDGKFTVCPKKLDSLYSKISHLQKQLARKRDTNPSTYKKSHNYEQARTKLCSLYRKVNNIQMDLLQKFTSMLVSNYDTIVIEDLDVSKMLMTHVASKGLHRSLFGKFREILTYKTDWYDKKLILADKNYPSTQLCSNCGYRKVGSDKLTLYGNKKHNTKHNEYICYECGFTSDRDYNAVMNLLKLAS